MLQLLCNTFIAIVTKLVAGAAELTQSYGDTI